MGKDRSRPMDDSGHSGPAAGCAQERPREAAGPPHIPKVLIIGDSISIGYFGATQELLRGRAEVHHNPGTPRIPPTDWRSSTSGWATPAGMSSTSTTACTT
jgi:hypothetical protein